MSGHAGTRPDVGLGAAASEPYVELHETNSAVVLLVGERAYKFKKPVDLGFLDFSTRARRSDACRREVALNRRLAPDVYQGVGEVRDEAGRLVEHLVQMRRLPHARRLSRLILTGAPVSTELRAITRLVADFHYHCDGGPAIASAGTRDAVAERWQRNLTEARRFRGILLGEASFDAVERQAHQFLAGRAALFADRVRRGAVIDGHGDLLADDIFCLPDGPRILDCLDFDDRLRHVDRLDDLACLAMDLERLGAPESARAVLAHYVELTADPAPPSLVDHYVAYRAFMRAKVTCLQVERSGAGGEEATQLLEIAHRHVRESTVSLVLVGGAPGTGKTTAAAALADEVGAVVLSSDTVRKELAGLPGGSTRADGFRRGIYSEAWTERTYSELLRRAGALVAMGESVILDATWSRARHRDRALALAASSHSELVPVRCDVPAEVAARRIASRPAGPSDADEEVARRLRAGFEPWPDATVVRTTDPLPDTVDALRQAVLGATEVSA